MIVFAPALALTVTNPAADKTITIRLLNRNYLVTFDTARTPEQDVRRRMKLAEDANDNYIVPEWLELCFKMDPEYLDRATRDWKAENFVYNDNDNLRRIRERIETLDELWYPRELGTVVSYLKQIQETRYFFETQRLLFIQEGKSSRLAASFDGIDAGSQCSSEISRIASAVGRDSAYELARHHWRNCVNNASREKIGPYPATARKEFLTHYGIRLMFVEEAEKN